MAVRVVALPLVVSGLAESDGCDHLPTDSTNLLHGLRHVHRVQPVQQPGAHHGAELLVSERQVQHRPSLCLQTRTLLPGLGDHLIRGIQPLEIQPLAPVDVQIAPGPHGYVQHRPVPHELLYRGLLTCPARLVVPLPVVVPRGRSVVPIRLHPVSIHPASPLGSTSGRCPRCSSKSRCLYSPSPTSHTATGASGAWPRWCCSGRWCTDRRNGCRACRTPPAGFELPRPAWRTPAQAPRCSRRRSPAPSRARRP